MRLARASIRLRSDHVSGYRMLTISAAMAGQTDIASAALQELKRAQPNFSLAWIAAEHAVQIRRRPRALSGGVSARRPGLAAALGL